jgi:hypothetical protein
MRKSILAEVHQPLARRIRASAAVSKSFVQGASSQFTVAADNGYHLVRETPIACQVLRLYRLALLDREHLSDLIEELQVASLARKAD